jgi:hypothetical protein
MGQRTEQGTSREIQRGRKKMVEPAMNFRSGILFSGLFIVILLFAPQADASKPIARITSFKGEPVIQSDTKVFRVARLGSTLNDGDRIQTKQGEVKVTFNDGAVMKIRPFTNTMIQERQEKGGFWFFKTKKAVRRITCFIGKLWFKTGASERRNYLQTPTAVCGVRGSDGDIGFDTVNTYLNMYSGEADVVGKVIRGFFTDPGIEAATKSRVYQSLEQAAVLAEQARTPVQMAQARVAALRVISVASIELAESNPDMVVTGEAQVSANVAAAHIAAGQSQVAVAQLQEAGASEAEINAAQSAADNAQAQADLATQAADTMYEDGVLNPQNLDGAMVDTQEAAAAAQDAAGVLPEVPGPPEPYEPPEVPGVEVPLEEEPPIQDTEPVSHI